MCGQEAITPTWPFRFVIFVFLYIIQGKKKEGREEGENLVGSLFFFFRWPPIPDQYIIVICNDSIPTPILVISHWREKIKWSQRLKNVWTAKWHKILIVAWTSWYTNKSTVYLPTQPKQTRWIIVHIQHKTGDCYIANMTVLWCHWWCNRYSLTWL